jgi:bifunctional DNase/RNase
MIVSAETELQQRKVIELDARPSDCLAMAVQQKAPIYINREVWNEVEDMTDVLKKMEEQPEEQDLPGEEEKDET